MAVYVDPLFDTEGWSSKWPFKQACHMMADTDDELHVFAARLKLKRAWHQACPPHSVSHYDLTAWKRTLAVRLGAVEVDRGFVAGRVRARVYARDGLTRSGVGPLILIDEQGAIVREAAS